MKLDDILNVVPVATRNTFVRPEPFGALLASGNRPILSLNEDSKVIWDLCDGTRTVHDILVALSDIYEDDSIEDKLAQFLNYSLQNGLLEDARKTE